MSTATFMTEFRSKMTFEYKAEMDISQKDILPRMPPQQLYQPQQGLPKTSSESILEMGKFEKSDIIERSPGSSRATSLTSSPALPIESTSSNGHNHDMRDTGYPSSDDSVSMPNDLSGYNGDQDEMPSPLAQLQCALEKNGMLGKRLSMPRDPSEVMEHELMAREQERNGHSFAPMEGHIPYDGCVEIFKCHLCSYSGPSKSHFNSHMNSHFDHKCPFCDYTSRTEGRLKRHVKDFHSETPPDSWAGTRVPRNDGSGGELSMDDSVSSTGNSKNRTYRCKQCGFVAYKKNDFWEHNKTHIKAEKLLTCPQCAFVTEYKHHLEYHIRNHFGSKPFKCVKCNYSCVNKSMLNSHMKSHSNIYQYRCSNCSYATKYCHSLKLHLRKYDHKPASVLNVDGTPNPYPVIDVYGSRRGPRPKKRSKFVDDRDRGTSNSTALVPSQGPVTYAGMSSIMPSNMPMLYPPPMFNGYPCNMFIRPPNNGEHPGNSSHFQMKPSSLLKCLLCDFATDHQEIFHKHMLLHAAKENQDLIKLYGISSDSFLQMQEQQIANNYLHNRHLRENGLFKLEIEGKGLKMANPTEDSLPSSYHEEHQYKTSDDKTALQLLQKAEKVEEASAALHEEKSKLDAFVPQLKNYSEDQTEEHSNSNRSVIVSHKRLSPVSPDSHQEDVRLRLSSPEETKPTESSPLDLSNCKGSSSRSPPIDQEDGSCGSSDIVITNTSAQNPEAAFNIDNMDQNSLPSNDLLQAQPRNRRKGKAFKLDRYLKLEDRHSPLNSASDRDPELSSSKEKVPDNSLLKLTRDEQSNNPQSVVSDSLEASIMSTDLSAVDRSFKFLTVPDSSPNVMYEEGKNNSTKEQFVNSASKHDTNKSSASRTQPYSAPSTPNLFKPLSTQTYNNQEVPQTVPKTEQVLATGNETNTNSKWQDAYMCTYCDMAFRDCVMYTMHMGYHGYGDPFACNMCGYESKDKVEFFLHIARIAHT